MNRFIKFPAPLYPLFLTLTLAQLRVLVVIVRQTVGWHKTHDAISLTQFQRGVGQEQGTGMSRTHIIAAVRWLEGQQIIRVVRQVSADGISLTSIYSLAERFLDSDAPTIDMTAEDMEAIGGRRRGTVSPRHHGDSLPTRPTKDNSYSKETSSSIRIEPPSHDDDSLRMETNAASTRLQIVENDPSTTPHSSPKAEACSAPQSDGQTTDLSMPQLNASATIPLAAKAETKNLSTLNEASDNKSSLTPRSEVFNLATATPNSIGSATNSEFSNGIPDAGLVSALLGIGFSMRIAEQMLTSYPEERIRAALDNVPYRKARNPAGYMLSELKAGDFAPPRSAQKLRRTEFVLPQPTAEEQAQTHQDATTSIILQEAIARLDGETRTAFWEEARRHCARLSRKSVPEDSPLLQAQFELIVQARVLQSAA